MYICVKYEKKYNEMGIDGMTEYGWGSKRILNCL